MRPIGFIGTGIMGRHMVRNLLKEHDVLIYNRTVEHAMGLQKDGAVIVDSPSVLGKECSYILCCVSNAQAVEEVVFGEHGLIHTIGADQVFIDLTTSYPLTSVKVAEALREKGADMIDAPVSGGEEGARDATLSIMAGGRYVTFERCVPTLNSIGKRIVHIGPNVGDGGLAKLANQIMVATNIAAMGEALTFGAAFGLDIQKLADALSGGLANSKVLELKLPKILSDDYTPGGKIDTNLKDLTYATRMLASKGLTFPYTQLDLDLHQKLSRDGRGGEDHAALVKAFEEIAKVKVSEYRRTE